MAEKFKWWERRGMPKPDPTKITPVGPRRVCP